jgi:hypothetical protein
MPSTGLPHRMGRKFATSGWNGVINLVPLIVIGGLPLEYALTGINRRALGDEKSDSNGPAAEKGGFTLRVESALQRRVYRRMGV